MTNYVEDTHEGFRILRGAAARLDGLSDALRLTGNDKLADRLDEIASTIDTANTIIEQAISQDISDRYRKTTEEVGGILKAALTAATAPAGRKALEAGSNG